MEERLCPDGIRARVEPRPLDTRAGARPWGIALSLLGCPPVTGVTGVLEYYGTLDRRGGGGGVRTEPVLWGVPCIYRLYGTIRSGSIRWAFEVAGLLSAREGRRGMAMRAPVIQARVAR